MSDVKFYFDERVELAVSQQLALNGFDVVSAHSLNALGRSDTFHLQEAIEMDRVLCTYDQDFSRLGAKTSEHAVIIFAPKNKAAIGGWIRELRIIAGKNAAEELSSRIFYLSTR
ncbi:MAG: DUF5615 family PIN-like protein [Anaerolineae bacterium]|nr:DUF5615 family PIN-like protein [Anaerolineae bacterium]